MIIELIGFWSHALAALLFAALMLWQLRHWRGDPNNRPLVVAFAVTAVWSNFVAFLGTDHFLSGLAEGARNLTFLAFMYGIVQTAPDDGRQKAVKLVYAAVAGAIGMQIVIAGVLPEFTPGSLIAEALKSSAAIIGLTIASGSLVLVHNLYGQASPESRGSIRLPVIALAAMWVYDLNLYTITYLTREPVSDLAAMRGAVMAMLVPLFALASKRTSDWRVSLSRAATFQSLSVMAIFAYLIVMMSATRTLEIAGGEWIRIGQVALVLVMTVGALILLPSKRNRAWLRVVLTKHFFQHRYDYREEWLRFTRTMARPGEDAAPVEERVVKAISDIADAPGGLLLLVVEQSRLVVAAEWNWPCDVSSGGPLDEELVRFLEATSHVMDFDELESGAVTADGRRCVVPTWMLEGSDAWAGVPLIHKDRLIGLVLLLHPIVRRPLDWEDFDLFRAAGNQAASYLAEKLGHEALATAQRFDEFNRRFAFIMHDIKNLVSQLALVSRNAERHADNPEFRADMVATLQSSVKKMNDLLARLSRGGNAEAAPPRVVFIQPIVAAVAEMKRRAHPVELHGPLDLVAQADPARLEQVLVHLVQNAIDVSVDGAPVRITLSMRGREVAVEVSDRGCGMSPAFIRTRLFEPFVSTKAGGFGIGAFEARSLVAAMGGRLEVESRPGEGSRFTIYLPAAEIDAAPLEQRKRA
jgi:putative PEP-CTERM system histidine kinase